MDRIVDSRALSGTLYVRGLVPKDQNVRELVRTVKGLGLVLYVH